MALGSGDPQNESDEHFLASSKALEEDVDVAAEPTPGIAGPDKPDVQSGPDLSSVITQVTAASSRPPLRIERPKVSPPPPPPWRFKMRNLFCCFAPAPAGYHKQQEGGGGNDAGGRPIPVPSGPPRELVMGPKRQEDATKKTLVLDLDETLVHSSFKPIPNPDYIIPVEIDGKLVDVYVLKRPWMDHFMEAVGQRYEVVVFTASLSKYADPLLDLMDVTNTIRWRLFRESCCPHEGNYVKDLTCLGRDLAHTIIVDNSPHSYAFQPANALPVGTFIDDMNDQELLDMLPVLANIEHMADVRPYLGQYVQAGGG